MWPGNRNVIVEVERPLLRKLNAVLRQEGYETDGHACADLKGAIEGMIRHVCDVYNAEIERAAKHPAEEKSPEDLVNWTSNEMRQFVTYALQIFQQRLVDFLSIDHSRGRPITCGQAITGLHMLGDACVMAAREWCRYEKLLPSGARARRRRAAHLWRPRNVNLEHIVEGYFAA